MSTFSRKSNDSVYIHLIAKKSLDMLADVVFVSATKLSTEDEFNKAIDNIKPEPTFKNTWPSMAVHVVISRDDIVITNETIGSILYKYRDTATICSTTMKTL